ncbi:MAG: phosphate signaling complex protein PhoU [Bacteriovoracia bacterium]
MERHFEHSIRELRELLVGMAGYVERAIDTAIRGLKSRDLAVIQEVFEIEKKVNQDHIAVDDACVKLLALHQPMAIDLRLIVSVIKINTDLERMGDQAVNIAHNAEFYLKQPELKPLIDLAQMFEEVKVMVRVAIDSFVTASEAQAREVLKRDDKVDELKRKVFNDVVAIMKQKPAGIDAGLALILIARNLERLGDHATNIAEDVIYVVTGRDIRHAQDVGGSGASP